MNMVVEKLKGGEAIVGTMIRAVRNPAIALMAANAGLDFFMLDMEHSAYSFETLADVASLSRAKGVGCFVRVPELAKGYVSRALDCGATGVMVPMIKNGEEAAKLAGWSKFPPIGVRGLGGVSTHSDYRDIGGISGEFMAETNPKILTIAQIELACAIDNIDEIAAVDGIDALLIGPADLSISYGIPGEFNHPKMDEAISKVAVACKKHGKIFGMHAAESLVRKWMHLGLTLRMSSMDISLLTKGMAEIAKLKN